MSDRKHLLTISAGSKATQGLVSRQKSLASPLLTIPCGTLRLSHDVSAEARDDHGRWTEGAGKKESKSAKHLWQMSRSEWETAGRPDSESYEDTPEAEKKAIRDFFAAFKDPVALARQGQIEPAESSFAASRDTSWQEKAAKGSYPGHLRSKLPVVPRLKKAGGLAPEDARDAIRIGRHLGYRDEDILHYLLWNYIPGGDKILEGQKLPKQVRIDWPELDTTELEK
jgi:hypothetical protein